MLQQVTQLSIYARFMANRRPPVLETLSRNLRTLMEDRKWTQRDLAAKSDVSQRQISNILNQMTGCGAETIDALARPFGLEGWQLLLPNLPAGMIGSTLIGKLIEAYVNAPQATRNFIDSIAEREAKPPAKS